MVETMTESVEGRLTHAAQQLGLGREKLKNYDVMSLLRYDK